MYMLCDHVHAHLRELKVHNAMQTLKKYELHSSPEDKTGSSRPVEAGLACTASSTNLMNRGYL